MTEDQLNIYLEGTNDAEPWPEPPEKLPAGDDNLDRLQFTYAAMVTFLDAHISSLLEQLRKRGLLDQMLLVFTSSRGLPLGEHGWIGPQRAWQHAECVHLPLIVRLPQAEKAGERIGALTQPVDVVPTLLDFLNDSAGQASPHHHPLSVAGVGTPTPEKVVGSPGSEYRPRPRGVEGEGGVDQNLDGRSLWPLIRHQVSEIRPFACSGDRVGSSVEWSLRTLEWAFLLPICTPAGDGPREPQLYVKPDDRWEVNDVRQHHLEEAEQMEKTLRDFVRDSREGSSREA